MDQTLRLGFLYEQKARKETGSWDNGAVRRPHVYCVYRYFDLGEVNESRN